MFEMIKQSFFQLMDDVTNCWSSTVGRLVTKTICLVYTLNFLLRVVLYCTAFIVHSLYLIGLVPSMSVSFSLTFLPFIEVNSDKDFGSTLEAVVFMNILV